MKGLTITTRAPRLPRRRRTQYGTLGGGRFLGVPWWGWLLGATGLGGIIALIVFKRKDIGLIFSKVVAAGKEAAFAAVLPSGVSSYAGNILVAANSYGVSPWLLAGIMYRESTGGLNLKPPGPRGTGDFTPRSSNSRYYKYANPSTGLPKDGLGWGRGLMQIDYGVHNDWVTSNDWGDVATNLNKAASIVQEHTRYFQAKGLSGDKLVEAALAAYNAGPGNVWNAIQAGKSPSSVTTGGDYANWVLSRVTGWAAKFS